MSRIIIVICAMLISSSLFAQNNKVTESEFKVSGVCEMCKTRIEKSMKIKEVKHAKWNKKTQTIKLAFLSNAITSDSLMKRIAAVGHDNESYKAPDSVYAKLHSCCLYREGQSAH